MGFFLSIFVGATVSVFQQIAWVVLFNEISGPQKFEDEREDERIEAVAEIQESEIGNQKSEVRN